jgi:hypothetical protein
MQLCQSNCFPPEILLREIFNEKQEDNMIPVGMRVGCREANDGAYQKKPGSVLVCDDG